MFNRKQFIVAKALENKAMLGQHTIDKMFGFCPWRVFGMDGYEQ